MTLGASEKICLVLDIVLAEEAAIANPSGDIPRKSIRDNVGVPLLRLAHQPPLVATVIAEIATTVHVAGLGPTGGAKVPADFHLAYGEAGAKVGLEQIVRISLRAVSE